VGAIISSFVPVHLRGRIVPNYAMIDHDNKIPFWRAVGKAVHEHDCKFIMQLSHGGRQRDINGIEYPRGLSSTGKKDPLHGFECDAMTIAQIKEVVGYFAEGARRAREAGLDGVELHGANGYLITQFLSSAINDRKDEYGGSLENRARFVLDIVKAVRAKVGNDFHFQMKISAAGVRRRAVAAAHRLVGQHARGLDSGVQVAGRRRHRRHPVLDGRFFPHPKNPCGSDLPVDDLVKSYDTMISSGERTFANFLLFTAPRACWRASSGTRRPGRPTRSREEPARRPRHQGGGQRAGHLHRRVPDRVGDRKGDPEQGLRRREHGAHAGGEQRSAESVREREGSRGEAVHLLQPLPRQRGGKPARVLRRVAVRQQPRRDDRADHVGVRSAAVRGPAGAHLGEHMAPGLGEEVVTPDEQALVADFVAFLKEASLTRAGNGPVRRFNQTRTTGCVRASSACRTGCQRTCA
jgi:hypothetical protein